MGLKFRNRYGTFDREKIKKICIRSGHYSIHLYKENEITKESKCKVFTIHKLIARHFIPNPENYPQVNHKDINELNNRIENLEWTTISKNNQNKNKKENCSSQYIGVCWNKQCQKYQAQIMVNENHIYLGLFNIEEEAAKAYDIKALELFGSNAKTNFKIIDGQVIRNV